LIRYMFYDPKTIFFPSESYMFPLSCPANILSSCTHFAFVFAPLS
jgi:hypothetical protein